MSARRKATGMPREEGGRRRSRPELTRGDFEEVAFPQQAKILRVLENLTLEWFEGPDLDRLLEIKHGGSASSLPKLGVSAEELLALSQGIFSVLGKLAPWLDELEGAGGTKPGAVLVPLTIVALISAVLPLHNLAYFSGYGADPLALVRELKSRASKLERAAGRAAKAARRSQRAAPNRPILPTRGT